MNSVDRPHPVNKPFFTFGTLSILIFMGIGYAFGITRLILGIKSVTNLDNTNTWGIWISFDVACGVALAAGGFTTAALVDIFGKKQYKPLLRPAIMTAFLGYLWVAIALSFDLGRWWNIWRPVFNWQGNSVLFEVGMCVMAYLTVLAIEMSRRALVHAPVVARDADDDRPHQAEPDLGHPDPSAPLPDVGDHGRIPDGHPGVDLRQHQLRP